MGELFSQLMTPQMQTAFTIIVVMLAILYVLSIIWVIRDAYMRGSTWYVWGLVALVPFVGVVAYLLLRPPLLQIDRDEQELEILLKQRQLMQYGECATCGYPVEVDYIVCPNCHSQLKNQCPKCSRALEPTWTVCPFCATQVKGGSEKVTHRHSHKRPAAEQSPAATQAIQPAASQQSSGKPAANKQTSNKQASSQRSSNQQSTNHSSGRSSKQASQKRSSSANRGTEKVEVESVEVVTTR